MPLVYHLDMPPKQTYLSGKIKKKVLWLCIIAGIFLTSLVGFWILGDPALEAYEGLNMRPSWDVADNILTAPDNKTFATFLYDNGYIPFLHGEGPFTVFVPIESGVAKFPDDTLIYLLDKKNNGALRQTLLYHVVKGEYLYDDLKDGMTLQTVEGEELTFSWKDGRTFINDHASIQTYDIVSTNGVIHTITNYLEPPSLDVN